MSAEPYLINFQKIGSKGEGFISIAEASKNLPFVPKRIFWTYNTPALISRGRHAHLETIMIIIAVNNSITINCETISGIKKSFVLSDPNIGLYIPKLCWHGMEYSNEAVQLVIASTDYEESDYIRDYGEFTHLQSKIKG